MPRRPPPPPPRRELSAEELGALRDRYWNTKDPRERIARSFRVNVNHLHTYVAPLTAPGACAFCGGELEYRNRTQRSAEDGVCRTCGHHRNSDRCACEPCKAEREALLHRREEELADRRAAFLREWRARYANLEHVKYAVAQLTPAQRLYLDGVARAFADERGWIHWTYIAEECGQSPAHVPRWLKVFQRYNLLYVLDEQWGINPALQGFEILSPLARRR